LAEKKKKRGKDRDATIGSGEKKSIPTRKPKRCERKGKKMFSDQIRKGGVKGDLHRTKGAPQKKKKESPIKKEGRLLLLKGYLEMKGIDSALEKRWG